MSSDDRDNPRRIGDPAHLDEFLYLVAGYRMFASVSQSRPDEPHGNWMLWHPDGVAPEAER